MALASLALAGCVGAERSPERMGGVWGYIAEPSSALIECNANQLEGEIVLDRVKSPERAWVVVRPVNPAYNVINGVVEVPAGESKGVRVKLRNLATEKVYVSLHVDRGRRGQLDFEPARFMESADRPIFTRRTEVARQVSVADGGREIDPGKVALYAEDQGVEAGKLMIRQVIVDRPSWLTVHRIENNAPGRTIGIIRLEKGEYNDLRVALETTDLTDWLEVSVHEDAGQIGTYEYLFKRPFDYADQIYEVAGVPVALRLWTGEGAKPAVPSSGMGM